MGTVFKILPYVLRYMNGPKTRRPRPRSWLTGGRSRKWTPLTILFVVGFGLGFFAKDYLSTDSIKSEVVRPAGSISWQVYFSPNGGCTDAIVRELNAAKKEIRVLAYSFTSKPVAVALVNSARRGVNVQVILDKSQQTANYSEADFLAHANIPTFIDDRHAIQHNKVIVVDGVTVLTGSFNFSSAAEKNNAENLVIIRDPEMAQRYLANWSHHQQHANAYRGR